MDESYFNMLRERLRLGRQGSNLVSSENLSICVKAEEEIKLFKARRSLARAALNYQKAAIRSQEQRALPESPPTKTDLTEETWRSFECTEKIQEPTKDPFEMLKIYLQNQANYSKRPIENIFEKKDMGNESIEAKDKRIVKKRKRLIEEDDAPEPNIIETSLVEPQQTKPDSSILLHPILQLDDILLTPLNRYQTVSSLAFAKANTSCGIIIKCLIGCRFERKFVGLKKLRSVVSSHMQQHHENDLDWHGFCSTCSLYVRDPNKKGYKIGDEIEHIISYHITSKSSKNDETS